MCPEQKIESFHIDAMIKYNHYYPKYNFYVILEKLYINNINENIININLNNSNSHYKSMIFNNKNCNFSYNSNEGGRRCFPNCSINTHINKNNTSIN